VDHAENQIIFNLPSGIINLFVKGSPVANEDSGITCLAFSAGTEIALSSDANSYAADTRGKIAKAKEKI